MKASSHQLPPAGLNTPLHALVFIVAMLSFALNTSNAWAVSATSVDARALFSSDEHADHWQAAFVFEKRPPRRLRAKHIRQAFGPTLLAALTTDPTPINGDAP